MHLDINFNIYIFKNIFIIFKLIIYKKIFIFIKKIIYLYNMSLNL